MPTHRSVPARLRSSAKRLRRDMTDAERKLWFRLRAHRLDGLSFRRQTPIGAYIADFVCHEHRLVIELDGGQHAEDAHAARDAIRDAELSRLGYHVLRIWNSDIFSNMDGVLEAIMVAVRGVPPSRFAFGDSTSPSGGEEWSPHISSDSEPDHQS
ncbi:endonuclease domain-containing protein [Flaviflagellibacter deserti]|uniref:Endonuclease domain-containing protein n=1 Tax=Flaviflagellibacter deserti TaxID=2267266 RepID=A0ABV9Z3E5_9HYPH